MTIDNFDILGRFLMKKDITAKKSVDDSFWKIELVIRKKDNCDVKQTRLIASYNVHSYDEMLEKKDLITVICKATGARAYLSINRKSEHQASLDMLVKLSSLLATNASFYMKTMYESVMLSTSISGNKRVLVDADGLSRDEVALLIEMIDSLRNDKRLKERCKLLSDSIVDGQDSSEYTGDDNDRFYDNVICCVPTPNGWHLVCHPFIKEEFNVMCMEKLGKTFDMHTNNLVLLYYNNDKDDE